MAVKLLSGFHELFLNLEVLLIISNRGASTFVPHFIDPRETKRIQGIFTHTMQISRIGWMLADQVVLVHSPSAWFMRGRSLSQTGPSASVESFWAILDQYKSGVRTKRRGLQKNGRRQTEREEVVEMRENKILFETSLIVSGTQRRSSRVKWPFVLTAFIYLIIISSIIVGGILSF